MSLGMKMEAERLLRSLAGPGSIAVRSAVEKRLSAVLRQLGPSRVVWSAGQPAILVALGGDSMYGARRAVHYTRRVG